jgi:hypothetical protein
MQDRDPHSILCILLSSFSHYLLYQQVHNQTKESPDRTLKELCDLAIEVLLLRYNAHLLCIPSFIPHCSTWRDLLQRLSQQLLYRFIHLLNLHSHLCDLLHSSTIHLCMQDQSSKIS